MKLEHCLLACNENTHYLSYWSSVKRAWNNIIGIPVTMVYIGKTLPYDLKDDPCVKLFEPINGMPTTTQAQMIRLLYPAIIDCSGGVIIGDMDCMPLNKSFFLSGFSHANENQFVSLKAPMENCKEICIMYVGATPSTWGDFMNIKNINDIRKRIEEWSELYIANGKHGGLGWTSDQLELYKRVKHWEQVCPERLNISKWEWDFPRLDRCMPNEWIEIDQYLISRLLTDHYIDFHMPSIKDFPGQIESILLLSEGDA